MNNVTHFAAALSDMPVIAILRGVTPAAVVSIGDALCRAGIRIIEVPLNSPEPLVSLRLLADHLGDTCVIGAGTVLAASEVEDVAAAGGRLIVSPNTDANVIDAALQKGGVVVPGVATPTEALYAYSLGARYLKLFPASSYGTSHVGALSAVLPGDASLIAVGGVGPGNINEWLHAGVSGVGIGSEIYQAGDDVNKVRGNVAAVVASISAGNQITTKGDMK